MADAKGIASTLVMRMRQIDFRWQTGIGHRESFLMMTAPILVTSFVRAFLFRERENFLNEEIRGRAMYTAYDLAALTSEYIVAENRDDLRRRPSLPYTANEDSISDRALICLLIYNKNGKSPIGKGTAAELGLGLPICYRIIQNYGGRPEANSAVGNRTTFRIFLPQYRSSRVMKNVLSSK